MLATVEFSFAKDDQGKMIDFTPQFATGLAQYFVSLRHLYPPVTDSFIVLAPLRSSLAISHHALISVQSSWTLDCSMYTKNYLSESRFQHNGIPQALVI